jgi:hypothetical protein
MNAHSSRSHAIFSITIECSEKGADNQQHFRLVKQAVFHSLRHFKSTSDHQASHMATTISICTCLKQHFTLAAL